MECHGRRWNGKVWVLLRNEGTVEGKQGAKRGDGGMAVRGVLLLVGLRLLGGCMHRRRWKPSSDANLTPRDKKLLANAPYAKASIPRAVPAPHRHYHRKEAPGSIVIDTDARYLYYVLPRGQGDPLRRDRRRRGLAFSGIAKVGRKEEWPTWTPTADIKKRSARSELRRGRPAQSAGRARPLSLQGNKDTLFRIHGTNQPEYIGQAISSGCIRMTNEDVIDLYNRVKIGTPVVVLAPKAETRRPIRRSPTACAPSRDD